METALTEDVIEVIGHGRIEIRIHGRNELWLAGVIDGVAFAEFNVDKRYGAAKWGPGWVCRMGYAMSEEEQPCARVTKIILAEIEKWASRNNYRLDLYGRDNFTKTLKEIDGLVDGAVENIEVLTSDTVPPVIDQYGDWLEKFDNGKLLKDFKQMLSLYGQVRELLTKVIQPDLSRLQTAAAKYFPQSLTYTIEPNWDRVNDKASKAQKGRRNNKTIKAAAGVAA